MDRKVGELLAKRSNKAEGVRESALGRRRATKRRTYIVAASGFKIPAICGAKSRSATFSRGPGKLATHVLDREHVNAAVDELLSKVEVVLERVLAVDRKSVV